jgi:hypothetical protein
MSYEGGGPAPYGGSASAPIGAPTPGPGDDWEAVVDADEDAEKDDHHAHGSQALNATDNPEYAENVKENREAEAEAGVDDDNDQND